MKTPVSRLDPVELDQIVQATAALWPEMRGQRLFITGGTGFIGTWLLESFVHANRRLSLGAEAIVLSRNPDAFLKRSPHLAKNSAVSLMQGDVRSFSYPTGEFAFIVHGATNASAWLTANRPGEMLSTIVDGAERVLAFAEHASTRKLLMLSSGAVYGTQPPHLERLEEEWTGAPDPLRPGSVYGEGKRFAELLAALQTTGKLEVKIARCFSFVGPHLPLETHFAAGNFIADVLAGRSISIKGDGRTVRSYLYASDLAVWLWTVLFSGKPLRPYNVGSEEGVTMRALADATIKASHQSLEIQLLRADSSLPTRYVPSTERARQELGLKQTIGLEDALRRTIEWHRLIPHEGTD